MTPEESNSKVIALVDDDPSYRSMIEDFLLFQGLKVASFSEPESFLGSLGEPGCRYALVISDINMPKISGLELLREVRTKSPEMPVILMTAAPSDRDEETSRKLGAKGYLSKPCRLADVLAQVQTALAVSAA
jgi:DNA-binding response OmpR family regulator